MLVSPISSWHWKARGGDGGGGDGSGGFGEGGGGGDGSGDGGGGSGEVGGGCWPVVGAEGDEPLPVVSRHLVSKFVGEIGQAPFRNHRCGVELVCDLPADDVEANAREVAIIVVLDARVQRRDRLDELAQVLVGFCRGALGGIVECDAEVAQGVEERTQHRHEVHRVLYM